MTDLSNILSMHKDWLNDNGGTRAVMRGAVLTGADLTGADLTRADLRCADLTDAVLRGAVLTGAVLTRADLRGADLTDADLTRAVLRGADLTDAVLRGAVLTGAVLTDADLTGADLRGAVLRGADLTDAVLRGAVLTGADLTRADLRGADLTDADLTRAVLTGADLTDAKNVYLPLACPSDGAFVAWKKARIKYSGDRCIVKLMIYDDAKRSSATGIKCRCNKAKVLAIYNMSGIEINADVCSIWDSDFLYIPGGTVTVPDFDENRWNECSTGIHFFVDRAEAERYDG